MQFFNQFNRRHSGWFAEIEVHEPGDPTEVEARRLPFEGITVDTKPGAQNTTSVILELQSNVHLNHLVPHTKRVEFVDEAEPVIQVTASNGDQTIVRFHPPARPAGLLPPPRRSRRTEAG